MAYTFLKAQGHQVGKSLVEEDKVELAKTLARTKPKPKGIKFLLPADHVVADEVRSHALPSSSTRPADSRRPDGARHRSRRPIELFSEEISTR